MHNHVLAEALQRLGHQVTILAARTSAAVPAEQERRGLFIHRLLVRSAFPWRRLPGLGRYERPFRQLLHAARVNQALRRVHAARPIAVVEFTEVNAEGYFFARRPPCPVVVRCQTPNFVLRRYYTRQEAPYDTAIIVACEKSLIRRAHALIAPSVDMARTITEACGLPPNLVRVIPNGLPVPCPPPPRGACAIGQGVVILHVGRLERAKGVGVLTKAIPLVLAAVPTARFVFVGDDCPSATGPSTRAELERALRQAGVAGAVQFRGRVDEAGLAASYAEADICTVPSVLYESFSYTCAQAMAAGKPVVATRIGGIPETVGDGVQGLLVPPGDAPALAAALIQLAREPALRAALGRAGRERVVAAFDPVQVAQMTLAVYAQAHERFHAAA